MRLRLRLLLFWGNRLRFRGNCSLRFDYLGWRWILSSRWILNLWSVLTLSVVWWNYISFGLLILNFCRFCSCFWGCLGWCGSCCCFGLWCSLFWSLFNCLFLRFFLFGELKRRTWRKKSQLLLKWRKIKKIKGSCYVIFIWFKQTWIAWSLCYYRLCRCWFCFSFCCCFLAIRWFRRFRCRSYRSFLLAWRTESKQWLEVIQIQKTSFSLRKRIYIWAAFLCCFWCWGLWLTFFNRRFWSWQFRRLRSRLRSFSWSSWWRIILWSWLLRCRNGRVCILSCGRWFCRNRLCALFIVISFLILIVIVIFSFNGLLHIFEIFLCHAKRIK